VMKTRGGSERERFNWFKTYKRAVRLNFNEPEDLMCVCVLHNRLDVFEPKDGGDVTPLPNPFLPLFLFLFISIYFHWLQRHGHSPLATTATPKSDGV